MSELTDLFRAREASASPEWGQNLELAARVIQEALCHLFERVARVLMA
jgi:hypothetical protein